MKKRDFVADICLYGTPQTGAGYLACRLDHGQTCGNGEPVFGRPFTSAVFLAVEQLRGLGLNKGRVRIFEPRGECMAIIELSGTVPTFGDLQWGPAPQYTNRLLTRPSNK